METKFLLDTLANVNYPLAQSIINQLAQCHSREQLSQILNNSVFPIIGCSGTFYVRFEGEDNTPKLLASINTSELCQCRWKDLYEISTQNQFSRNAPIDHDQLLATEAFCCIGDKCVNCTNDSYHDLYRNCTFIALFDSAQPSIALFFFRMSSETHLYSKQDIELLQILRATLLQTIDAISYREECHNLRQILYYSPDHDDLLAVVNVEGQLVYKNKAFIQTVGKEASIKLLTQFTQKSAADAGLISKDNYLSKLGKRLYEVSMTTIEGNINLTLLRLSRVTDKKLNLNRNLNIAGLSSRELEIASLLIQGMSTHNVSEQLSLSYHTVRNHIKHIYGKLGISTRSEMLTWGDN